MRNFLKRKLAVFSILTLLIALPASQAVSTALVGVSRAASSAALIDDARTSWVRHTIDDTLVRRGYGADGLNLADVNGDGLLDLVVPWEFSWEVRAYLNPGLAQVANPWPYVTVGKMEKSFPEDAAFADLDNDGSIDVISAAEEIRKIYVHWAPTNKAEYMNPDSWTTEEIPAANGIMQWKNVLALQIDGKNGLDILASGEEAGGRVAWLEAPANPRDVGSWQLHRISRGTDVAGITAIDMDGDGDMDVAAVLTRGKVKGVRWLVNPGPGPAQARTWETVAIAGIDEDVTGVAFADMDKDGLIDAVVSVKGNSRSGTPNKFIFAKRLDPTGRAWQTFDIRVPEVAAGARAVLIGDVGDVNGDGNVDIVFAAFYQSSIGIYGMSFRESPTEPAWTSFELSAFDGSRLDVVKLVDLNHDGYLDALVADGTNGVAWFENPAAATAAAGRGRPASSGSRGGGGWARLRALLPGM